MKNGDKFKLVMCDHSVVDVVIADINTTRLIKTMGENSEKCKMQYLKATSTKQ